MYDEKVLLQSYFKKLIDRFYKIIPLKEEYSDTLNDYLDSLRIELIGSQKTIELLSSNVQFMSLINVIEYMLHNDFDKKVCKREVFKCIKTLEKLCEMG